MNLSNLPPKKIGRYQILERLGDGGMGTVFLANASGPQGIEQRVAIKLILDKYVDDQARVDLFLSEARLVAKMSHPNIIHLHECGEELGRYFIVMELVDGVSLRELAKQHLKKKEFFPLQYLVTIASGVCEGLAYAHDFKDPQTGERICIVHRDISPENILIDRQTGHVKIVDFGIAKLVTKDQQAPGTMRLGKPEYAAPERLRGHASPQSDIYSLGVILYELSTGRLPFTQQSSVLVPPRELRPEIPASLARLIERSLRDIPMERHGNCREFLAELQESLEDARPAPPAALSEFVERMVPSTGMGQRAEPEGQAQETMLFGASQPSTATSTAPPARSTLSPPGVPPKAHRARPVVLPRTLDITEELLHQSNTLNVMTRDGGEQSVDVIYLTPEKPSRGLPIPETPAITVELRVGPGRWIGIDKATGLILKWATGSAQDYRVPREGAHAVTVARRKLGSPAFNLVIDSGSQKPGTWEFGSTSQFPFRIKTALAGALFVINIPHLYRSTLVMLAPFAGEGTP